MVQFSLFHTDSKHSEKLRALLISIVQVLAYVIGALPLRIMYRTERKLPHNLHLLRRGSLIVSNHQSMLDPFIVSACLPFHIFLKMVPIRPPVIDYIFRDPRYNPPFFPILKMFGCFSIGKTSAEKMKSIFYIRELLKRHETVFLFPEGGISTEHTVKEFKQGVDFFMDQALNVIFVRLRGFNKKKNRASGYKGHQITFGEVFEPAPHMSVEEMRQYLEHL